MDQSQSFADYARKTLRSASSKVARMEKSPNQVLADNLDRLMKAKKLNNPALSKKAKLATNTIKNYRNANREGSANLADLQKLATALEVKIADLITEQHGTEPAPAPPTAEDLRINMVHEAVSMLAHVLDQVDEDGRAIVAPALRSFALNPHGAASRLVKAFATALDMPLPPEPPLGQDQATPGKESRRAPSLTVKPGGGDGTQSRLPLPPSVRKIIDNTSPASLRASLDNETAPKVERDKFHARVKQYQKTSGKEH